MTNEERDKTIAQIERIQKHLASVGETVDYLDFAIEALEEQRNLTNEELYQSFIKLEAENERLHDALESSISIPSGATNGDVIKALFPNCERESRLNEECIKVMGAYRVIDRSWWNAPYKRGEEDDE